MGLLQPFSELLRQATADQPAAIQAKLPGSGHDWRARRSTRVSLRGGLRACVQARDRRLAGVGRTKHGPEREWSSAIPRRPAGAA